MEDSNIQNARIANAEFLLNEYIKIKPLNCHDILIYIYDNINDGYVLKVPFEINFTEITCSLLNHELVLPPIINSPRK